MFENDLPKSAVRPDIYAYLDYRKFLKDFLAYKKNSGRRLSYRGFGRMAGFKSPYFLKMILDGSRNLTPKMAYQFAKTIQFKDADTRFFLALVLFNQSKSAAEQKHHYEQISQSAHYRKAKLLESYQYDYFSKWPLVVLRELVAIKGFKENPKWIRKKISLDLKDAEIAESFSILVKLGLLQRDDRGQLQQTDAQVKTAPELEDLSVVNFHRAMIEKAGESIEKSHHHNRDISSLTVSINKKQFDRIKEEINLFRSRIHHLASSETDADTVYQVNFQLFNLSEVPW